MVIPSNKLIISLIPNSYKKLTTFSGTVSAVLSVESSKKIASINSTNINNLTAKRIIYQ